MDPVAIARQYLGTPFHHAGRLKGIGIDCAGLIICVGKEIGAIEPGWDYTRYGRRPDGSMQTLCDTLLDRLDSTDDQTDLAPEGSDLTPGTVILFRIRHEPQHLAIATDRGMIHSYIGAGVVENAIDDLWRSRIVATYRYRTL